MPLSPGESVLTWFERAIIADRLADDLLSDMMDSATKYNEAAASSVRRAAERSRHDLDQAQIAYLLETGRSQRSA